MNQDEHQRERMATWRVARCRVGGFADGADELLAEFDKRFPAPVEPVAVDSFAGLPVVADPTVPDGQVKVVEPPPNTAYSRDYGKGYDAGYHKGANAAGIARDAELATLRQKARLWDAVASGKVYVYRGYVSADVGGIEATWNLAAGMTAAEAVQAAIDAGALK